MPLLISNLLLGAVLASVPLIAEAFSALAGNPPGVGLELLLYWPFDFALPLLALIVLAGFNAWLLRRRTSLALFGAALGVFVSVVWFAASFMIVAQVHISRGGQL